MGEKIAIVFCIVLWALLLISPVVVIAPLDGTARETYRLINVHLLKSAVLIFATWIALLARSVSFRFKAFIYKTIGFKENEALFSLSLLLILLVTYVAMWDMVTLLKNNITYTISLSNWYFITCLVLVAGIWYTLWHSIVNAKNIAKASILTSNQSEQQLQEEEDMQNFKDHIVDNGGLF